MIPEGWKQELVNDLCSQISVGIVVKPADYYVEQASGIRAFRSANVGEGFVKDRDWIYISEEGHRVNRKSVLRTNDVLIVRTGYPGTACLVPPEYEGSNCIDIIFARPKPDRIVPSYLCVFTNSEYGKKQVLDGQGGLAQQHFNVGAFKQIRIPLPPLGEQRRIAEILATWDRAIETVEALIANARAQKKALMQGLLTGKHRLPGFTEEWKEATLGTLANLFAGGTPSTANAEYWGGSIPWMSSGEINLREVYAVEGRITEIGLSSSSAKMVPLNSVLMALAGQGTTRGKVAISRISLCTNQSLAAIVPHKNLDPDYLFYNLDSRYDELRSLSLGDGGRGGLNLSILKAITIPAPVIEEQIEIASVLRSAGEQVMLLETKLAALRQEKSALMQQLLTGKRRVKMTEREAA